LIRLLLKKGREESVRRRHPWLFSGAVESSQGDGSDGKALVLDPSGVALAEGAYSEGSQIVARLWAFAGEPVGPALFRERFADALALRRQVVEDGTTGFRLVNSEGDRCPGVLADRYGDSVVLELLTGGTEAWAEELEGAARTVFSPGRLLVRRSGSWRDRGASRQPEAGSASERISFVENGLRFFADLSRGQKTGFFLDQRENRARLRGLARGATMLNLFSYSGAFSVAALAGGAARSVDVDTSEPALELAREQRADNGFDIEKSDFVRADVFEDLRRRTAARESWDIVVCDPPAFAKKKGDIDRAARGYQDVNRLAMMLVRPGGWLLTCSCSGLVGADLFQKIVFAASVEARRSFTLVARQGAGPDHPVSLDCPEGEYLKGMWLRRAN
jgi:23S rRNA (cytosine1962-C5)-methyltransferase